MKTSSWRSHDALFPRYLSSSNDVRLTNRMKKAHCACESMMRYKSLRAPPWSSRVKWIPPARLVREYNESSTGLEAGESACPVCPRNTKTVRDTLATWGSSANHLPFESKSRFRGIQMSQGNNKRPNPPVREVLPNSLFSLTSLSTLKRLTSFSFLPVLQTAQTSSNKTSRNSNGATSTRPH